MQRIMAATGISMSVVFDKRKFHENLRRQGKRLSELLNVPLTEAQFLLAIYVYQEKSFKDVKEKIDRGQLSGRTYLSAVGSDADREVIKRFTIDFGELLVTIQSSPISTLYSGSCRDLLLNLFSLTSSDLNL